MTAKEMAHWERWHRRGRRKFQLTIALIWFAALGPGHWLLGLAIGSERSLFGVIGTALLSAIVFYLSTGCYWNHRTAVYLEQRQAGAACSVQG